MKKLLWILPIALLLAGCGGAETLETISDAPEAPVSAAKQKILVQLPPELSSPTLQSEQAGELYICDDYTVTVQTVDGGDMAKTIRDAVGLEREELELLQTKQNDADRYQWVWASAGESGIQLGRGCIIDDGNYHYVLTALTSEETAAEVQAQWHEIFASFRVTTDQEDINIGS